jgi:hypothetical protein
MKLLPEERFCYNVANAAATGTTVLSGEIPCPVCQGCGLLKHPSAPMNVATCYWCNGRAIVNKNAVLIKKETK